MQGFFSSMVARQEPDAGIYSVCKAFERMIRDNKGLIDRICFYYAASVQEYEDLCQDVYINLWRGMSEFREECSRSTWIYRVCLNTCVSSWRRNGKHKDNVRIEQIVEPSAADYEQRERLELLHYLISQLSPSEKALIMMWLDEKSYDEISEVTGFNRNTVATKLRRIKEKLTDMAHKDYI